MCLLQASNRMFALISKYKGSDLIAWTGADQGIYSSDKEKPTANFALPFTPRRLISSSGGIVVVIGRKRLHSIVVSHTHLFFPSVKSLRLNTSF